MVHVAALHPCLISMHPFGLRLSRRRRDRKLGRGERTKEGVNELFVVQCSIVICHLSSVVALRAIFSKRCRAEGAAENEKWQLNIEQRTISSHLRKRATQLTHSKPHLARDARPETPRHYRL